MNKQQFIAITRFGLGAKPNFNLPSSLSAQAWLKQQLTNVSPPQQTSTSESVLKQEWQFRQLKKQQNKTQPPRQKERLQQQMKALKTSANKAYRSYVRGTIEKALVEDVGINWRLLDFFSNHFSITANNRVLKGLAPSLEMEAIAPNLYSSFADMLVAVTQHPAMLLYLNNERSIGPNSKVGKRKTKSGINENLAREILELHTLGVRSGYQQNDVIELAKAITGWSLAPAKENKFGFRFNEKFHEPGKRTILQKSFSQRGIAKGEAILRYLASRPETACFISTKLAKHFISDTPSQSLIESMQAAWLSSNGNIKSVIHAMIDHPSAWLTKQNKFKTPREFFISSLRASGAVKLPKKLNPYYSLNELGQLPFNAGSPAGYKDDEANWLSPSSMLNRVDWSAQYANSWQHKVKAIPNLVTDLFDQNLTELSRNSILRAESKHQALTLLLMSPEFQRR